MGRWGFVSRMEFKMFRLNLRILGNTLARFKEQNCSSSVKVTKQ